VIRALLLTALVAALLPAAAQARGRDPKFFGGVVADVPAGTQIRALGLAPGRAWIATLRYGGGPVLHWNRTHVIFWQPAGSGLAFDPGYEQLISTFLGDVAADSRSATNVYGLSGQYSDAGGPAAYDSVSAGAVLASDPLPANGCTEPLPRPPGSLIEGGPGWSRCLTDLQLVDEIRSVIRTQRLPTTRNDIYFLVTPSGLGSCESGGPAYCALGGSTPGSYCGYHSVDADGLLYAVIPYNAVPGHCQSGNPRPNESTADPAISTLSHEHNETVTDPLGDAWIDPVTNKEDGDACITEFGPDVGGSGATAFNEVVHGGHYYLQEEWSNDDGSCRPRDETDRLTFTAPARPRAHKAATFTAHARDPDGSIVAYDWSFGDRGTGHSRTPSHTFKRPGVYQVVLRTTDRAGNWTFASATVRVEKGSGWDPKRRRGKREP
jgi:hypothetical protein